MNRPGGADLHGLEKPREARGRVRPRDSSAVVARNLDDPDSLRMRRDHDRDTRGIVFATGDPRRVALIATEDQRGRSVVRLVHRPFERCERLARGAAEAHARRAILDPDRERR